jgi:hypothetical protein
MDARCEAFSNAGHARQMQHDSSLPASTQEKIPAQYIWSLEYRSSFIYIGTGRNDAMPDIGKVQEGNTMETEFTPWMSLGGGVLIGISAILLMVFNGRIAGMTGILTGIIPPISTDWAWRIAFLAGAVLGPVAFLAAGGAIPYAVPVSLPLLAFGGLIVGVGVYYGAGCTSGHGVCGMARLSPRSIAATVTFMIFTGLTVYVVRHIAGI